MAVSSDIDVTNIALSKLGETNINDFTTSKTGQTAKLLYDALVEAVLGMHIWAFARKKVSIGGPLGGADIPVNEWENAYQLPTVPPLVKLLAVYNDSGTFAPPLKRYERFEDKLFTNETTEMFVDYIFLPAENKWPGWFILLIATALAADLAVPITGQVSKKTALTLEAWGSPAQGRRGGLYKEAAFADSIENPTKTIQTSPGDLVLARIGSSQGDLVR